MSERHSIDDKRMLDTARQVADFAYKQGVGEASAVDHLIQKYEHLRQGIQRVLDLKSSHDGNPLVPNLQAREMLERLASA